MLGTCVPVQPAEASDQWLRCFSALFAHEMECCLVCGSAETPHHFQASSERDGEIRALGRRTRCLIKTISVQLSIEGWTKYSRGDLGFLVGVVFCHW